MRIKLMPVSIKVKEIKAAKRNWFSSICVNNKSSPKKVVVTGNPIKPKEHMRYQKAVFFCLKANP